MTCRYIFLYALLTNWMHQWGDNFEKIHNSLFNELRVETQAEAEMEPMKKSSYWLLLASIFAQPRTTCPWNSFSHGYLGSPISLNNQDNSPSIWPQVNVKKTVLQLKFPFTRCFKLTAKISHHESAACQCDTQVYHT